MPMQYFAFQQLIILRATGNQNVPGICNELSKRWVTAHLRGEYRFGLTLARLTGPNQFDDLVQQQALHRRDNEIDGFTRTSAGKRRGVGLPFKYTGLRGRTDVITRVLDLPGAYTYSFCKEDLTGGHTVALCSLHQDTFYFFDANVGEFMFQQMTRQEIIQWWGNYWEDQILVNGQNIGRLRYKQRYSNGRRELNRFTLED